MAMLKHVGKVGEKPCVVLFKKVPLNETGTEFDTENCLVIETGGLGPQQHDALMDVVQSSEGQSAHEISQVLNRRQFPDGTNMLSELHYSKKISKVPVALVKLSPAPNQDVPLADVNAELYKIQHGTNPPGKTEVNPASIDTLAETIDSTTLTEDASPPDAIAKNLIAQADLIESDIERTVSEMKADAESKRAQAYELAPDLKPKRGPGRPPKND